MNKKTVYRLNNFFDEDGESSMVIDMQKEPVEQPAKSQKYQDEHVYAEIIEAPAPQPEMKNKTTDESVDDAVSVPMVIIV